jgi:hypothetical protein
MHLHLAKPSAHIDVSICRLGGFQVRHCRRNRCARRPCRTWSLSGLAGRLKRRSPEAAPSETEQPAPAGSRDAAVPPTTAAKSNWEAAELARRAAAGKPSRAPADSAAEAQPQREHGDSAAPPSRSIAGSRRAGDSTAVDPPQTAQDERPGGETGAAEGVAQPAAAQKAAALRRNDEDRVAAARERFLARKRKIADV